MNWSKVHSSTSIISSEGEVRESCEVEEYENWSIQEKEKVNMFKMISLKKEGSQTTKVGITIVIYHVFDILFFTLEVDIPVVLGK